MDFFRLRIIKMKKYIIFIITSTGHSKNIFFQTRRNTQVRKETAQIPYNLTLTYSQTKLSQFKTNKRELAKLRIPIIFLLRHLPSDGGGNKSSTTSACTATDIDIYSSSSSAIMFAKKNFYLCCVVFFLSN